MFYPLIATKDLYDGFIQAFEFEGLKLLLIQYEGKISLIENQCGHFGVELENGTLRIDKSIPSIVCPEHGISFSLSNGEVVNRPYENCQAVKLFDYEERDGKIGLVIN